MKTATQICKLEAGVLLMARPAADGGQVYIPVFVLTEEQQKNFRECSSAYDCVDLTNAVDLMRSATYKKRKS
jgi:hypothetical protein